MARSAPNTCCCKWRTSTTLQGWNGKRKPASANRTTVFAGRCPRGKLERRPVALVRTARVGQAGLRRQGRGYAGVAGAGCAEHPSAVFYKGRLQSCFGRLLAGGAVCAVGATRTDTMYGVAAASPSVWFPGWPGYEAAHPIQTQRVYLSLGDREEHTKKQTMASVGDNIRALHSALTRHGTACTLEWNTGGHFKDVDPRTARAFAWVMEGKQ